MKAEQPTLFDAPQEMPARVTERAVATQNATGVPMPVSRSSSLVTGEPARVAPTSQAGHIRPRRDDGSPGWSVHPHAE
jgi:hypothetical protein